MHCQKAEGMRIAILTQPLYDNFGGILQCYALQTVLKSQGHKVDVLGEDIQKLGFRDRISICVKRIIKFILRIDKDFYGCQTADEAVARNTRSFVSKHIRVRRVRDLNKVKEGEYDALVVGSDQVWRKEYNTFHPLEMSFLDFAKNWNVIRVAYAASFGTDIWDYTPEETEKCRTLLGLFQAVSVRETSGIELCRRHLDSDAVRMPDPTLLLPKEHYLKFAEDIPNAGHEGGLFVYLLDDKEDKRTFVKKFAEKTGLNPFMENNPDRRDLSKPVSDRIQYPVERWLSGFRDAKFVITDSFHGCVFSILFNRPFLVIRNNGRGGSRFESLLDVFGLSDCLVSENDILDFRYETVEFDWKKINAVLDRERQSAHDFLCRHI